MIRRLFRRWRCATTGHVPGPVWHKPLGTRHTICRRCDRHVIL